MQNLADEVNEGFDKVKVNSIHVDDQFKLTAEAQSALELQLESQENNHQLLKSYTEQVEENLNTQIAEVNARVDDLETNKLEPALQTIDNLVQRQDKSEAFVAKSTEEAGNEMLTFKKETMDKILNIQKTFTEF